MKYRNTLLILIAFTITAKSQDINIPQNKKYIIQSAMTYGKNQLGCWDIPGINDIGRGKNLQEYQFDKGCNQYFSLTDKDANGYYNIYTCNNKNFTIDVSNGECSNGTNVLLWNNSKTNNQKFKFHHLGNGKFKIEAKTGGYICLAGRNYSNHTNIHIWENHDGAWMEWYLVDPTTKKAYIPQNTTSQETPSSSNTGSSAAQKEKRTFKPGKIVEYNANQKNASIKLEKMNVFYIGIANPIDIELAGIKNNAIKITAENAIVKREGDSYNVYVNTIGKCTIKVNSKQNKQTLYSKNFRVKTIPTPVASVSGKRFGYIYKNELLSSTGLTAELKDFDFDVKWGVKQFTVSAIINGSLIEASTSSNTFTADQKSIISKLNSKQKVYIDNIEVIGPDGKVRELAPIILKIE